jgi:hypothetical protein
VGVREGLSVRGNCVGVGIAGVFVDVAGTSDGGSEEGDFVGDGSDVRVNVTLEPGVGGRICVPDERHPAIKIPSVKVITHRSAVLNGYIEAGSLPRLPDT